MSFPTSRLISYASILALSLGVVGCQAKLSEEAKVAQDASKTADERVAKLEQELAELKSGKATAASADKEVAEQVAKAHQKAIEKQLADAKRRADEKKKAAQQLAAQPAPKEAPKPVVVEVPAGTSIRVNLAKTLTTETVQAGDSWEGSLAEPVVLGGKTIWRAGTEVQGVVTQSMASGRLSSGKGGLGIRLTAVDRNDVDADIHMVVGEAKAQRNAKFIGGGAALGALIGVLSDKKNKGDHALGGAAIGAAAGTAVAAGTADTVIKMPAETPVEFQLTSPEKVNIKP